MAPRQFCFYVPWNRPAETRMSLAELDNRFPTMTEVRRALWPAVEPMFFDQPRGSGGIDEVLEMLILGRVNQCASFISGLGAATKVLERKPDSSLPRELDQLDPSQVDTLVVLSFDHFKTEQTPSAGEVTWIRQFLNDPSKCVAVCPHHDVGASGEYSELRAEFQHHGDTLVPPQDGVGGYARALLRELGYPIENRFGLKALTTTDGEPAELIIDSDPNGFLKGVTTFTAHPHIPHLAIPDAVRAQVRVLARQPVQGPVKDHPFFKDPKNGGALNALLQIDGFKGTLLVSDLTLWLGAADRGERSLKSFWRNMASM